MSNTDSFIDEVNEEVRKDRLFVLAKRWGWLPLLVVVGLVGGAAWSEWQKAQTAATAQGFGDAALVALGSDSPAEAMANVTAQTEDQEMLKALLIAATQANSDDPAQAAEVLQSLADRPGLPPIYRQLALLKAQTAGGTGDAARDARILEELATPGSAFRPLAMEQQALRLISTGDTEGALSVLQDITQADGTTDVLRRRAMQLIVALGGDLDPA